MANPESLKVPKERVTEKWKRIRSLTAGGQGQIFLVKRNDFEQEELFVQKRLKNSNSPERQRRFLQETETTARLQHPNILKIIEDGIDPSPPCYISEYLEGGALDSKAIEYRADIAVLVRDLLPIVDALNTARQTGVFHRDIKPANILSRKDGTVVLGDFGICFVEGGAKSHVNRRGRGFHQFHCPWNGIGTTEPW